MAAIAESDYQPESTSGNHDTKKEKQRKQSSYSLGQKHFFFADDYAIDKNFKNKKLQLKQKGVR